MSVRATPCPIAHYFERFLPERIASLGLGAMDSFTTTFAFVINDLHAGRWTLRFEHGSLIETTRAGSTQRSCEDFSYHMDSDAFWDVVAGQGDPRDVFLSGRAEIVGDVEQALKTGMILARFAQVHPYPKARAQAGGPVDA